MSVSVLIHSPVCGPGVWQTTAHALRALGHDAIVPAFSSDGSDPTPLWQQQTRAISTCLHGLDALQGLIWVGHSGAGLGLPVYRQALPNPAQGYIFVDAGLPSDLPPDGLSQLDAMRRTRSDLAEDLHGFLVKGGRFPEWTDSMLRDVLPDDQARAMVLRELQPQALRYFEERMPVSPGWPDAPCVYVHFSDSYNRDAAYAISRHWAYQKIAAAHFICSLTPGATAQALVDLVYPWTAS